MYNRYGFVPSHWGWFGEGSARSFGKSALKYLILSMFEDKPAYVYEVMHALKEQSQGMYSVSRGSVHSTLQILADVGYLTAKEINMGKVYTITDSGRTYLKDNHDSLDLFNTFLEHRFPSNNKYTEWQQTFKESQILAQRLRGKFHELDNQQLTDIRDVVDKSVHDIENIVHHPKKPTPPDTPKSRKN